MPVCIACGVWGLGPLCRSCRRTMIVGPHVEIVPGLALRAALRHVGAARRLVHRMKYEGSVESARLLARAMAGLVPRDSTALVPVPRAVSRRIRHGSDPALLLAREISRHTGYPIVRALAPTFWWPRHANAARRVPPRFRRTRPVDGLVVLVDDVATTGATLLGAKSALGVTFAHGITATAPIRMRQQAVEVSHDTGEVA